MASYVVIMYNKREIIMGKYGAPHDWKVLLL